jgi:hypothetical protein
MDLYFKNVSASWTCILKYKRFKDLKSKCCMNFYILKGKHSEYNSNSTKLNLIPISLRLS